MWHTGNALLEVPGGTLQGDELLLLELMQDTISHPAGQQLLRARAVVFNYLIFFPSENRE